MMQRAAGADLLEVRLDALPDAALLADAQLEAIIQDAPVPSGFTCRRRRDGGAWDGAEAERRRLLERAAAAGAAFIDVELDAGFCEGLVVESAAPVIVSHHWERPCPDDLEERAGRMAELQPAVAKLVAPAEKASDILPLVDAGRELVESGQPTAAFCMAEAGRASRLLLAGYGGALTYATLDGAQAVASGQWSLEALLGELRLPRWTAGFRFCGLIGDPIGHSLSPTVFNAAFDDAGRTLGYLPVPSSDLDDALRVAETLGFRGLSVTMPFKEPAAERCTELEPLAEAIGAVNTLTVTEGGWSGANTDAAAVVEALKSVIDVDGAAVALVGAGGAARAAAVGLGRAGAAVTVVGRTEHRAREVAGLVGGEAGPITALEAGRFDVIVNATPVGMPSGGPEATPFPPDWLQGHEVVLDMVYRPRRTALLRAAAARGCTCIEGLEMFLRQAAAQYRLWIGDASEGPLVAMRKAAEAVVGHD